MKKTISKVVFVVLLVILVPILVFNIIIMLKSFIKPNEVPGVLGYKPMIVLTGSMEPNIMRGDLVVVKETKDDLVKDDIISYRDKEGLIITHRIVAVFYENGIAKYTTQGDANNEDDGIEITNDMVEGIYKFRIPKLGGALEYIQTPTGIIITSLSILLVVFILISLGKAFDERELNKEFEEFKKLKKESNK